MTAIPVIKPNKFQTLWRGKWIKYTVLALIALALWTYRASLYELISLAGDRQALIGMLDGYGGLGAVLLFLILALQVLLAAIPGHAFMVAGGYLYGFTLAFIITHVSTVFASQVAYELARRYGRPVVERLAPAQVVDKWTLAAKRQGLVFFFFSFILPIFPSDVMNFVAGLSGLSPRKFLLASGLGRLPTSILFVLIGASGFRISPALLVTAVVVTIAAFILWKRVTPALERRFAGGAA